MERFSRTFLEGKANFRLETEVLKIWRERAPGDDHPAKWIVRIRSIEGKEQEMEFSRIILATGVCGQVECDTN